MGAFIAFEIRKQSKDNSIEKEKEIMIRSQHQILIKFYGYLYKNLMVKIIFY